MLEREAEECCICVSKLYPLANLSGEEAILLRKAILPYRASLIMEAIGMHRLANETARPKFMGILAEAKKIQAAEISQKRESAVPSTEPEMVRIMRAAMESAGASAWSVYRVIASWHRAIMWMDPAGRLDSEKRECRRSLLAYTSVSPSDAKNIADWIGVLPSQWNDYATQLDAIGLQP